MKKINLVTVLVTMAFSVITNAAVYVGAWDATKSQKNAGTAYVGKWEATKSQKSANGAYVGKWDATKSQKNAGTAYVGKWEAAKSQKVAIAKTTKLEKKSSVKSKLDLNQNF